MKETNIQYLNNTHLSLITAYRKKQFNKNDWYMTGLLHELNPAYIEEMIFYYNRCLELTKMRERDFNLDKILQ